MRKIASSLSLIFAFWQVLICTGLGVSMIYNSIKVTQVKDSERLLECKYNTGKDVLVKEGGDRLNTLILVIDGYPDSWLYERMTGKESELHKTLQKNAKEMLGKTISSSTFESIPWILYGIKTDKMYCKYPWLGNTASAPEIVLYERSILRMLGKTPKICESKGLMRKVLEGIFRPFIWRLSGIEICTFVSSRGQRVLVNLLTDGATRKRPALIHELGYHEIMNLEVTGETSTSCRLKKIMHYGKDEEKYRESSLTLKLERLDKCYEHGVNRILKAFKSGAVKKMVVMSDHGPRGLADRNIATKNIKRERLYNYYFTYTMDQ